MRLLPCAFSVAAVLFAAASVEAQVIINPVGPPCVSSTDPSSCYEADVRTDHDFWLDLKVFHNGVLKHESLTFVVNGGPSYRFDETVSHLRWGLAVGDGLVYRGRATLSGGPFRGAFDERDHRITASEPGACRSLHRTHCNRGRRRDE